MILTRDIISKRSPYYKVVFIQFKFVTRMPSSKNESNYKAYAHPKVNFVPVTNLFLPSQLNVSYVNTRMDVSLCGRKKKF